MLDYRCSEVDMPSNFWMIINNEENFRITQNRGFIDLGLKSQHRRKIQRITEGDRVLLYISPIRCFAATATASSSFYESEKDIWIAEGKSGFPYHIKLEPGVILKDEQFIDANILAPYPPSLTSEKMKCLNFLP